ncbi:hypothetical protein YPPY88_3498, partial [Yersinia pestis PY-88]
MIPNSFNQAPYQPV